MSEVERICPNCGASNPYSQARCSRCGADLNRLPVQRSLNLPARAESAGAAALVLGVTALVAREGLKLLARGLWSRMAQGAVRPGAVTRDLTVKPNSSVVEGQDTERPDFVVRGWRAWSWHSGTDHSSGSEQFEWRIQRNKER